MPASCPDVSEAKAAFLVDLQVPWGVAAFSGSVSEPRLEDQAKLVPGRDSSRRGIRRQLPCLYPACRYLTVATRY